MNPIDVRPLVSIITVTKNCALTIGRTLESVQTVKSPDIQYIIIDGQSTDDTLPIIKRHDNLVDVLVSERDTGVYNAMNKGAVLASGQYILFLNGDDRIIPEGFNKAKAILEAEHPEILSCRSEVFAENEMKAGLLIPAPLRLFFFNTIPHLSTFVSSDLQKTYKFREDMRIASDYDLFLRLFLDRHAFRVADIVTAVHYRGGVSGNVQQSLAEIDRIKKDNLGILLYSIVRLIESLNRMRKAVVARLNPRLHAPPE